MDGQTDGWTDRQTDNQSINQMVELPSKNDTGDIKTIKLIVLAKESNPS